MESLRLRLTALRSEESDLLAKVGELNSQIKQSREEHDKISIKLDTQNLRLQETEKSFSVHQGLLHSQGSLITGHEDYYSREDDLKVELDKKKEEARLLDISCNEAVLRNQHLETLRQKSNSRAAELENWSFCRNSTLV
ncbi:unnamed protein product [Dicrocoelium dendriticum]|nr:unnamed protein product [Dicrocoelium dendriticum]